jgi:serine/threonine-protein kinase
MGDGRDRTETITRDGRPTAVDPDAGPSRDGEPPESGERYRVLNRIGKGGMGEVMLVHDRRLGRDVALKRIRRAAPSEQLVNRFLREASVQARLEHPAIVPLYDLDHDASGDPFFTMKKLTGTTLGKILSGTGEHSLQRLLRAFGEVCLAIELAHTRGVIHRDLKPDNIVLGDFGEVYVLDWGVAKIVGEPDGEFGDVSSDSDAEGEGATEPGTTIGTPGYMAPEQKRGDADIDARVDVYALGRILRQLLASKHSADVPPPPELEELCTRATEHDRARRIATARELGERVQSYLDGDRDLATRRQLARDHLARAQAAFAEREDDTHRTLAMREAASALALDPALAGAAELVGRLMLEPPRTTPSEVRDSILEEDIQTMQSHARVGVWLFCAFLAFTPLLWWIAPRGSPYVLALSAMIVCNVGICWWGSRNRPAGQERWIAFSSAIMLAIVARMFTPLLAAPALAAIMAMGIVLTPTWSRVTSVAGIIVLASASVLGPWLLEAFALLPITTHVDSTGVMLHPPAIVGDETSTFVVASLYVIGLIGGASWLASAIRARERAARERLHLQAWQLRQLVPQARQ